MSASPDAMNAMLMLGQGGGAMGSPQSGYPMAPTNPLTQQPNMAQQAGASGLPNAGMSQAQKMMMAQALMRMSQQGGAAAQQPIVQPPHLMQGNNTGQG